MKVFWCIRLINHTCSSYMRRFVRFAAKIEFLFQGMDFANISYNGINLVFCRFMCYFILFLFLLHFKKWVVQKLSFLTFSKQWRSTWAHFSKKSIVRPIRLDKKSEKNANKKTTKNEASV